MTKLAESHPLDYDWRYSDRTVSTLCELLPRQGRILSVGAPSVARRLQSEGREVTLVDRQPYQGVQNHWLVEPGYSRFDFSIYSGAIVDSPWYVNDLERWVGWTAQVIGLNRKMYVSLWPNDVRPNGGEEVRALLDRLAHWADVQILDFKLHYKIPLFEKKALEFSRDKKMARSPRHGRVLAIQVNRIPKVTPTNQSREIWVRFLLNQYQLALRVRPSEAHTGSTFLGRHKSANDWTWPYVSRRAPGRTEIDLWSSRNEVAVVDNPNGFLPVLREALISANPADFARSMSCHPELLEWKIPRPPYWRFLEWTHLQ